MEGPLPDTSLKSYISIKTVQNEIIEIIGSLEGQGYDEAGTISGSNRQVAAQNPK